MRINEDNNKTFHEVPTLTKQTISKDDSILILSQFYWPEPIGTPHYVTDFSEWLAEKANKVTVVTGRPYYPEFKLKTGYEKGQRDVETKNGVAIFRLPTYVPTGGKVVMRILSELYFFFNILSRVVSRKIKRHDHVVSFSPSIATVIGGNLCTSHGGRHIAVVHDIQSGLASGLGLVGSAFILGLFRFVEKTVLNRVSAIIVLTPSMKRTLQEQGINVQISVLPIWVELNDFKMARTRKEQPPIVQYSGNLGQKQGIEQVLDLAETLLKRRPEIRILIRGGGSRFNFVNREVIRRGLINTELTPLLSQEQLPEGLSEADIHLVPQNPKTANFAAPSKIYPIMAVGRPIVATALPGSALWDLQEKTNGAIICVPPNNSDEFSNTVINLLEDEIMREKMGRSGRQYVEENASRNAIIEKYLLHLCGQA